MLRRLIRDRNGNALMWAMFLMIALVIIAMMLYTVFSTVSKVRSVETELKRCASIVLDKTTVNSELRDVILTLHTRNVQQEVRENLRELGWVESGGSWERAINGGTRCRIQNLSISIDEGGELLTVSADVQIPLLKSMGGIADMTFPLKIHSKILYISA